MRRSNLVTYHEGNANGPIWLVLHDRYGHLEDARALGAELGPDVLRIAIRAARSQTEGPHGHVRGQFWYIGPIAQPELSTFGDGLAELEALIEDLDTRYGPRQINLLGEGEGGVMALVLGALFADRLGEIRVKNADWPQNLARMPLDLAPPETLKITHIAA